jgi:microcystin degradation protein MlrC
MARLQVGGIDIVASSFRTQTLDPEVFLLQGIDVTRYKIVVVKSSNHFRAGFEPVAKAIITADSPGLTTLNVAYFPRERSPRPIWPVDQVVSYTG